MVSAIRHEVVHFLNSILFDDLYDSKFLLFRPLEVNPGPAELGYILLLQTVDPDQSASEEAN